MSTAAQIAANQANAKLSTGPKTKEGKTASAQNNFRHGLSGAFLIQEWEDGDKYDQLLEGLRREHQPSAPTQALLVERMAQHWWLGQRALRLQELCFQADAPIFANGGEKELALGLRYQTTHERAFSKCLNDLQKLRAHEIRECRQFEVQRRHKTAEIRKQEMHVARLEATQTKTELMKAKAAPTATQPAAEPAASVAPDLASPVRQVSATVADRNTEPDTFLKKAA